MVGYGWYKDFGKPDSIVNRGPNLIQKVEDRIEELLVNLDEGIRYFRVLHQICERVYNCDMAQAFPKMALTNVLHCHNTPGGSTNAVICAHLKKNCVNNNSPLILTKEEIKILKPNRIISIAGKPSGRNIRDYWGLANLGIPILLLNHPSERLNEQRLTNHLTNESDNFVRDPNPPNVTIKFLTV